jgi:hypothetical protein
LSNQALNMIWSYQIEVARQSSTAASAKSWMLPLTFPLLEVGVGTANGFRPRPSTRMPDGFPSRCTSPTFAATRSVSSLRLPFCCYDPAFLLRVDSSLCSANSANIYKKSWRESGKKLGVLKSMFSYCGDRSPGPSVFFRFFSFRIGTSCLVSWYTETCRWAYQWRIMPELALVECKARTFRLQISHVRHSMWIHNSLMQQQALGVWYYASESSCHLSFVPGFIPTT